MGAVEPHRQTNKSGLDPLPAAASESVITSSTQMETRKAGSDGLVIPSRRQGHSRRGEIPPDKENFSRGPTAGGAPSSDLLTARVCVCVFSALESVQPRDCHPLVSVSVPITKDTANQFN